MHINNENRALVLQIGGRELYFVQMLILLYDLQNKNLPNSRDQPSTAREDNEAEWYSLNQHSPASLGLPASVAVLKLEPQPQVAVAFGFSIVNYNGMPT